MKRARILFLVLFVGLISFQGISQKIKYKDLFYLLNAKKYEEAEPFLKSFLNNPKEKDHANANLQMGFLYQYKYKGQDILKETEQKLTYLDSAIHYYNLAKTLIDEKELKKQDEYYEDYYRRDLRTGKMGIKLSDVQLDIETRVGDLQQDRVRITKLKDKFSKAIEYYEKCVKGYSDLTTGYSDQNIFYLRSNANTIESLKQIMQDYDSSMGNFGSYKLVIQQMEFPGYDQILDVTPVKDILKDGKSSADFYDNNVSVWNYDSWAKESIKVIEDEIMPLHNDLIAYDKNLSEQFQRAQEGEIVTIDKRNQKDDHPFMKSLNKYDGTPFPLTLFNLKKAEITYLIMSNAYDQMSDSIYIDDRLAIVEERMSAINKIDSLVVKEISKYDLSEEALNYKKLVDERYNGVDGIKAFIDAKKALVVNNTNELEELVKSLEEQNNWLIYENDSIPLSPRDTTEAILLSDKDQYLYFDQYAVNDSIRLTFGVSYDFHGSPNLYVANVPPSHNASILNKINLDSAIFRLDSVSHVRMLNTHDEDGNAYILAYTMLYHDQPMGAHLLKVNNKVNVVWEKPVTLLYPPDVLTISNEFKVIAVNYDVNYIDKSKGLQLISRELFDMGTGEPMKEK